MIVYLKKTSESIVNVQYREIKKEKKTGRNQQKSTKWKHSLTNIIFFKCLAGMVFFDKNMNYKFISR